MATDARYDDPFDAGLKENPKHELQVDARPRRLKLRARARHQFHEPRRIRRYQAQQLVDEGLVSYTPGSCYVDWFLQIHRFSPTGDQFFQGLWENFLDGNRPMCQGAILAYAEDRNSKHIADIFKRSSAWKTVIVGDGKGGYWLHIPDAAFDHQIATPSAGSSNAPRQPDAPPNLRQ